MPVPLNPDKPLKRQIKVYGVETPVTLILHSHGVEMTVPGARTKIFGSWDTVARHLFVPENAPSIHAKSPIDFLKYLGSKSAKNKKGK